MTSETNKIDYVLNNLRSASLNPALSNRIQEAHKFYTKKYQANISKYLDHPTEETIFEIANNIKKGGG